MDRNMFIKDNSVHLKNGKGFRFIYMFSESSNPIELHPENNSVPFIGHGTYIAFRNNTKYILNTFSHISKNNVVLSNKIAPIKIKSIIDNAIETDIKFELINITDYHEKEIRRLIKEKRFKELIQYVNTNNIGSYKLCCDHSVIIKALGEKI